jgi:hypothetical protein
MHIDLSFRFCYHNRKQVYGGLYLEMVKKIQCRVIASAVLGNDNVVNNEISIEDNPKVNNFPESFHSEIFTYANRSGTIRINYDNGQTVGLLDLLF